MIPIPQDEAERLAALGGYAIIDTLPEREYDDLVRLAATSRSAGAETE